MSARAACGEYAVLMEYLVSMNDDPRVRVLAARVQNGQVASSEVFPRLETIGNVGISPDHNSIRLVFSGANPGTETAFSATARSRECSSK